MLKALFQKLLAKAGKTYTIDPSIPSKLLFMNLLGRLFMLLRGFFRLQHKVFLGKSTTILNAKNINFGANTTIGSYTKIDAYAAEKLKFGANSKIGSYGFVSCTSHFSKYGKGFSMGSNSAMGDYCQVGAAGGVTIGNDVIMGSYISFHSENHNFNTPNILIREQGTTSKGIVLGNNIWVGAKVTFLDGSQIGDHSVVAAGAVVNGVFPPNVIIGGVPAKIIKSMVNNV